jgi:NAD-dependent deacetylase
MRNTPRFVDSVHPLHMKSQLELAQEALKEADTIAVLTGAGISAESGIATFRDYDGLWHKHDPAVMSSMKGFSENPRLVWDWYLARLEDVKTAQPNQAHLLVAELETIHPVIVITQNVDDLHERAGSTDILHLHGDLKTARCYQHEEQADVSNVLSYGSLTNNAKADIPEMHGPSCGWTGPFEKTVRSKECGLPLCPSCGKLARPNVVWFGEYLPELVYNRAEEAMKITDLVIVIGTSGQVYPASGLSRYAVARGKQVISINTREVDHGSIPTIRLTGKSSEIMKELVS